MALSLIISDLSPFTLNDAEDLTGWLHLHLNVPDPEVSLIAEFYLRIVCHDQMASKASSSESRASIRHLLNRDHLDMALETFDVQLAPSERWNSSPLDTLKPLIARDNALTISEPDIPTRRKLLSTAYTTPSKKRDITVAPSEPEPITSNTSFEPEPNTYMASSEPEPNKSVPLCEPKPNTFVTSFESDSNAFMAPFGPDLNTFMAPFEPAPKTFMAPFEPEPNTSMTSSEPESNTFMAPFEPELNTFMTPFEPEPDTSMASFGSESTISCDTPTRPPSSRSLSLSWESLTTGPWSEVGMSVGPSDTVPVLCQPSASFCGSYLQPHGDVSITHIADTLHTTDPASVGLAAWDVVWDNDAWDSEFPMNLSSSIPDHHVSKTTDVCDDFSAGSSIDVTTSLEDLSTISDHHHSEDETTAVTSHVNNHF
ncbi:hypothetical protein MBLNU459_g7284t2 [Dothideomycetes sp. NU459]